MGTKDNELTLEGLAQRLGALQQENQENAVRLGALECENDELRSKVATLERSGTPSTADGEPPASEWSASDGQVSRKWLLARAGAAAVSAVAAGALMLRDTPEAGAHTANQVIQAHQVITHTLKAETHIGSINTAGVPVRGIQTAPSRRPC